MKAILTRVLMLIVSLGFTLAVVEIALRFTEFKHFAGTHGFPDGYFELDPVLGVDHAPDRPVATFAFRGVSHDIWTNSRGCFDHERDVEPGYILAIGDSHTWGYAALEDKWTTHLEALTGRQVLKCGVSGTGPRYQMDKARKVIRLVGHAPSVIVVLHTNNDLADDVVYPGYTMVDGQRVNTLKTLDLRTGELVRRPPEEIAAQYQRATGGGFKSWLNRNLVTAALARSVIKSRRAGGRDPGKSPSEPGPVFRTRYESPMLDLDPTTYPWLEEMLDRHIENIVTFQGMAAEEGAAFVLASRILSGEGLRRRLKQTLPEEIVYYLDLEACMKTAADGRSIFNKYDPHWNSLGNQLAGEGIAEYLESEVFPRLAAPNREDP